MTRTRNFGQKENLTADQEAARDAEEAVDAARKQNEASFKNSYGYRAERAKAYSTELSLEGEQVFSLGDSLDVLIKQIEQMRADMIAVKAEIIAIRAGAVQTASFAAVMSTDGKHAEYKNMTDKINAIKARIPKPS